VDKSWRPSRSSSESKKADTKAGTGIERRSPESAIATRYEKTARNFLAAVQLVASVVWLN